MATSIPQKMKAIALDHFGGLDAIGVRTVPLPQCGDDEILIHVRTAGVGAWDKYEVEGEFSGGKASFPYVPGTDGAGEVVAVGKKVKLFQPGDRAYGYNLGTGHGFFAEYATVKEKQAAKVPRNLSVEEAGALAADGITAMRGLDDHLQLKASEKLIIFGASGGIGHLAIQLAKRIGARVLAIASHRDGVELARRLGADAVVEGHDADAVEQAVLRFAPEGADAALVLACGEGCDRALKHIQQSGRIAHPNGVEPVPRGPKGVQVIGYDGEPSVQTFERLNSLIEAGEFHVNIGRTYLLEEAAKAEREVLKHHLGKLALKVS